jgi:tetratricopeptide (TPR) repeat protein
VDRERDKLAIQVARHVRSGAYAKALPEMDRLVGLEPNDMRLRLELADLCMRTGDKKRAIVELLTAARRYEREGLGLKAMGCYLQVTRIDPHEAEAELALGRHYAEHGLFKDASVAFGRALEASKDPALRLRTLAAILEMDPENLVDRIKLAEALSASGQLQEAGRELRKVLDVLDLKAHDACYPRVAERLLYHGNDHPEVSKRLAALCVASEEPQRALPRLKKAFENKPEDLEVLGLLATAFDLLGQAHKAVVVLKEMARLYDAGGLIEERDECWTRVLALDPNDPQAREVLVASAPEAVGQTFEVAYHEAPALSPVPPRPPSGVIGAIVPAPKMPAEAPAPPTRRDAKDGKKRQDFDDFDDFGDEVGFGGAAETTLVDDKFLPDEVLAEAGAGVAPPSTPTPGLQEDLRELDFYIANGLHGEAEALWKTLVGRHGQDNPMLDRREQQLRAMKR